MARKRKPGISYKKRVIEINRIYDRYAPEGVPNREIWSRYVYPVYGIDERTFYRYLKAPTRSGFRTAIDSHPGLFDNIETDNETSKENGEQ